MGKTPELGAILNIPLSQTLVPCVAGASCGPRLLPSWPPLSQPQRPLFYPSILQPKQSDKRGFLIFVKISKLISFISTRISSILLRALTSGLPQAFAHLLLVHKSLIVSEMSTSQFKLNKSDSWQVNCHCKGKMTTKNSLGLLSSQKKIVVTFLKPHIIRMPRM